MSQEPAGYVAARKRGRRPAEGTVGPFLVISEGSVFATDFERGCVALTIPDWHGTFDALDSDGVLCQFWTGMVRGHENYRPALPAAYSG